MRQTFDESTEPGFGRRHLPRIRAEMARQGLDGLLIPHEDEHQNEYLPDANDRLAWATGFTGSAGAAIVLADSAVVFVDGRYTLQVKAQVDPGLFAFEDLVENGGLPGWLSRQPLSGRTIGYDPRLHSPDALASLNAAAATAGAKLRPSSPTRWTPRGPKSGPRNLRRRSCLTRCNTPARTARPSARASASSWRRRVRMSRC
jgi:Xaa-Pro aminopeptidase